MCYISGSVASVGRECGVKARRKHVGELFVARAPQLASPKHSGYYRAGFRPEGRAAFEAYGETEGAAGQGGEKTDDEERIAGGTCEHTAQRPRDYA